MSAVADLRGNRFLKDFSKITCFSTLFLIFAGALVKSTGSSLSVADWPLSNGTLFPEMVGGVFYEHSHRMLAGLVAVFTLVLAVTLKKQESRRWVQWLGFSALVAVLLQAILGGITVKFFLPLPITVFHGILAQTFLILTIIIAYSQSWERKKRELGDARYFSKKFLLLSFNFCALIYLQLIIGVVMRHTHSGLAIPDFPTMGGYYVPPFNDEMLQRINEIRFWRLDPVAMWQVVLHFIHRCMALLIFLYAIYATVKILNDYSNDPFVIRSILFLDSLIFLQIILGIATVLSWKAPYVTSFHVVTGAATLGMSVLLFLRINPIQFRKIKILLRK